MNILKFLCSILAIVYIKAQDTTTVNLDQAYENSIAEDNGSKFYELTIPSNVTANTLDLMIKIKEPENADKGLEDFSDPDVYVSKTIQKPTRNNTTWFSERYGQDLLTIPKQEVVPGAKFYIGVQCEFKCRYSLKAELISEVPLMAGPMYAIQITKDYGIVMKFTHTNKDFKELQILSFSPHMIPYRMLVGKDKVPSSQSSLRVDNAWLGGFTSVILPGTNDACEKDSCDYYVLFESDVDMAEVFLFVKYEDTVMELDAIRPTFSYIRGGSTHCYTYPINNVNKDENIIVQTTMFSGHATVYANVWSPIYFNNSNTTVDFIEKVDSETVFEITKNNRTKPGLNQETGLIYVCLEGTLSGSYMLRVFAESLNEKMQRYNLLLNGVSVKGFQKGDSVTRYRVIEFTADSNTEIKLFTISGNPRLYGYICENIHFCQFDNAKFRQELNNSNLILPNVTTNTYSQLIVNDATNKCHDKIKANSNSNKFNIQSTSCGTVAIVFCDGTAECIYDILSNHDKGNYTLVPHKPHYQISGTNDVDNYNLFIDDDNIQNFTVVLNSITGDADFKIIKDNDTFNVIGASYHEGYIPDLITVSKQDGKSLKGKYNVIVSSDVFTSYSIYYYTHSSNYTSANKTYLQLTSGSIIKDYFRTHDKDYKVYTYKPGTRNTNNTNITLTLTSERANFRLFATYNISNISYISNSSEYWKTLTGAEYEANWSDHIDIPYTADNKNKKLYIIIIEGYQYQQFNSSNSTIKHGYYYLGASTTDIPFNLAEGISHGVTLDNDIPSQNYTYIHYNMSRPVRFSLNVFYGKVDIIVETYNFSLTSNSTDNSTNGTYLASIYNANTNFIRIPRHVLANKCPKDYCALNIMVRKSSTWDAQYQITAATNFTRPILLRANYTLQDEAYAGEIRHYYAFVKKTVGHSIINLSFSSGFGELFAKVISSDERERYPTNFTDGIQSRDSYLGKSISLNETSFSHCDDVCKILISVKGGDLGFQTEKISFSLSLYNSTTYLPQNVPYRSYVSPGEMRFFTFYFGTAPNAYISLTNMNGDADLYVNYGSDYPTTDNSTWSSKTPFNEYININKDDSFFANRKINDMSGNYTIMVYGYSETFFTIYVASHDKKIIELTERIPANCISEKAGDKCFFTFSNFVDTNTYYYGDISNATTTTNSKNETFTRRDYNFTITTDYLYGSCSLYGIVYKNASSDEISLMPSLTNSLYSSWISNSRRFMRVNIPADSPHLSAQSLLAFTVECDSPAFLDITITPQSSYEYSYVDENRENIYYLNANKNVSTLMFYNYYSDKDLVYIINPFYGDGEINIYQNITNYTDYTTKTNQIDNIKSLKNKIDSSNSTNRYYSKYISKVGNGNLDFEVKNIEEDFGFSVRVYYPTTWNKVTINKLNTFSVPIAQNSLNAYFDVMDSIDDMVLNIYPHRPNIKIEVFIKYIYYSKEDNATQLFAEPNDGNKDIYGKSDEILNSLSLNIYKPKVADKFIRILMSVKVADFSTNFTNTDVELDIYVTPKVGNVARTAVSPNTIMFVNLNNTASSYQILDLERKNGDDVLVVEISSCEGAYDFALSEKINVDNKKIKKLNPRVDGNSARKLITLENLKSNSYFLTVWPRINSNIRSTNSSNPSCTELMIYYYTDKKENIVSNPDRLGQLNYKIIDSSTVRIDWKVPEFYKDGKIITAKNPTYKIYMSDNETDYDKMASLCYLTKMKTVYQYNASFNSIEIGEIESGKNYYINVVYIDNENNEIDAFAPIQIALSEASRALSYTMIIICLTVIIVLIFFVYYFYKKFTVTKDILKYETSDIRNMSSVPRSEAELRTIVRQASDQKYSSLTEETSRV